VGGQMRVRRRGSSGRERDGRTRARRPSDGGTAGRGGGWVLGGLGDKVACTILIGSPRDPMGKLSHVRSQPSRSAHCLWLRRRPCRLITPSRRHPPSDPVTHLTSPGPPKP
jgi:hypothetical protein